jgi:hypothetical protein
MPRLRPKWWLTFTYDARCDMADRHITIPDVKNALKNQIEERPGMNRYDTTIVIVGTAMDGRPLCVTVEEEDRNRVVSLFWA